MKHKNTYNDEETDPLYSPQMREQEKRPWDVFEDPPVVYKTGSLEEFKFLEYSIMLAKMLVTVICFLVVLATAVVSKGSLLFITSQIKKGVTRPYCNQDLAKSREFRVTLPEVERVAWMWVLIFIYCIPECGTLFRSVRICLFKTWKRPGFWEFLSLFVTESLPAIGSAILVFNVLPNLDVIKGAMLTNAVCFVPGCVALFSRNPKSINNGFEMSLDIISVVAQGTALVVWPLVEQDPHLFTIPFSVLLISVGWWENFVTEDSKIKFISNIARHKKHFDNSKYFSYLFISVCKCLLFFGTALLLIQINEGKIGHMFEHFFDTFKRHVIVISEVKPIIGGEDTPNFEDAVPEAIETIITTNALTPLWVFLINVGATYICYAFGKWACKIMIQGFSFAFPVNLTVPTTISALIAVCGSFIDNNCAFYGIIPSYLFFNVPNVYDLSGFISHEHSWIWLIWLLSQTWITIHTWNPRCERLEKTEKLFMRPMYDAFLIDQSIALNRRRDEKFHKVDPEDFPLVSLGQDNVEINQDTVPRIYACATMWHETKEEMMEFLKSIMRLDADQCARRNTRDFMYFAQIDYYEFETHIMFDDAFVRTHQDDNDPLLNEYAQSLFQAIDAAATEVHRTQVRLRPPKLYPTPYGGRLVWTLPGKTKMYVHLKDKKKIRNKKRWSQVMYMYYLLGHRLMDNNSLSPARKALIAEHTFILALDGDIDFQPEAVHLLVNLMKKNRALGAACGRIHPIGSGPMVWYQMFEYAIGHWLQKSTEHMIGCVLCSPGCFSLFRGEALMDKNVMKKYTTTSELPRHYVQYDQGEDRWLCTLLLQRGYRVEYSAASDAYTHCPESFNEFYNQRRRWMPSTTANIMDLLMDYKRTVKINDNISSFYILYQAVLMIGTVLGPGTIFLMLVGAFVSAFQLDQWTSFVWNIIPILVFFFACALFKSDIQLFFAGVLSALYGLVMMAVLVGIMLQINDDGWLAPSSLFFFVVAGEMIFTALMHPKEFNCLKYGLVYYVTVPSMYMLLVIYSVFNMNNVSWGTREVSVVPPPTQAAAEEAKLVDAKPAKKTKKDKIMNFFGGSTKEDSGSVEFSFAGLFKCMLCIHNRESNEMVQLRKIQESVEGLSKRIQSMEMHSLMQMTPELTEPRLSRKRTTILDGSRASRKSLSHIATMQSIDDDDESDTKSMTPSDDLEENSWLYDGDLARGEVEVLPKTEEDFWKELLGKYLPPIDDSLKKDKIAKELKDLRDKVVMAFFMVNALFVLVVFLLTLKKEFIHVQWPFSVQYNFTYHDDSGEIRLSKTHLQLEPIGFVFLIFFAILLVVQFIAMLLHRFETFSQIMSTTTINFSCLDINMSDLTAEELLEKDPIAIAKKMQQLDGVNSDEEDKPEEAAGRRKTAFHLAKSQGKPTERVNDLDVAFQRRMAKCITNKDYKGPVRRDTVVAIDRRRNTVMKRQSQMQMGSPYVNNGGGFGGRDNPGFIDDNYPADGASDI